MRFLNPIWFAAAALAIPILAMYMLKLRRKEIEISSTMLWSVLIRDRQANTPWQKLKRNLLLFLQLLILASLILAVVRPALLRPNITSGSIVVLLDGSASMNAVDEVVGGSAVTRFEAAQAVVRGLITNLPAQATMTLILATNPPVVLANAERDAQLLRQAVDAALPGVGGADWSAAFAIAAGAAGQEVNTDGSRNQTTVVVVSDGGLPQNDLPLLSGKVDFIPVGQSDDNVAISALAIRPLSDASSPQEIFARVTNHSSQVRQAVISFYAQGDIGQAPTLFHSRQLEIPGQTSADIELSGIPAEVGIITARLSPLEDGQDPLDALALDDTAFAVSPQARTQRIYLLSQDYLENGVDNQFILRMLFALGYSPFRPSLQGEAGQRSALLPPDAFDLYILDGALPVDNNGQAVLPPSGSLLLINPPSNSLVSSSGVFTPTHEVSVANHPLTTYLDWTDVYVAQARRMSRPSWGIPLVTESSENAPLVFAGESGGRRVAVITFDLHDSDLPLHVAYPVLMSSLFNYLLPPQAVELPLEGAQPNSTVTILSRPDAEEIIVGLPDGSLQVFTPTGQSLEFSNTNQLGLYAVNTYIPGEDTPSVDVFTVNLFDAMETDITPRKTIRIGQTNLAAAEAAAIGEQEIWPWVALAALLILLIEWWAYHRPAWQRGDKILGWLFLHSPSRGGRL